MTQRIGITFLGTGTSHGVPVIGCDCDVCRSDDPHDKRLRTSAVIRLGEHNILIDATPDLRTAALANNLRRVDAILITHTHADHILGLDDARAFCQLRRGPIDLYAGSRHLTHIDKIFGYGRHDPAKPLNLDLPQLIFHEVNSHISLFGHKISVLELPHGPGKVLGFRIGPLAYCTDVSEMPDWAYGQLRDLKLLVLGALRPEPHPKHLTIDQAVAVAQRIDADQTYFVHMTHQISHAQTETALPPNIHLAYDGLRIDLTEI